MVLATVWIGLGVGCVPALADGGTLRFFGRRGDRLVTVFTVPAPLRAGPIDLSVLVQDAQTGRPITDLPIEVHANRIGQCELRNPCGGHDRSGHQQAFPCGKAGPSRTRKMASACVGARHLFVAADRIRCRRRRSAAALVADEPLDRLASAADRVVCTESVSHEKKLGFLGRPVMG